MEGKCIEKALEALGEANSPFLTDEQRKKLKNKIRKILEYYSRQLEEIRNIKNFYISRNKEFKLRSDVVSYIVMINKIINGYGDPNMIDKINLKQRVKEKSIFSKYKD